MTDKIDATADLKPVGGWQLVLATLAAGLWEIAKVVLLSPVLIGGFMWVLFGWAFGLQLIGMGWPVAGGLVVAAYVLMWAFFLGAESLHWDSRLPWKRR